MAASNPLKAPPAARRRRSHAERRAETQARIRQAAVGILAQADLTAVIGDPGPELMVEMMSVCVGEDIPPEYAGMMREEMGFVSRQVTWNGEPPPARRLGRRRRARAGKFATVPPARWS